jgi:hypothetical protein
MEQRTSSGWSLGAEATTLPLAFLLALIHRSARNMNSPKFAVTEFYEVRLASVSTHEHTGLKSASPEYYPNFFITSAGCVRPRGCSWPIGPRQSN